MPGEGSREASDQRLTSYINNQGATNPHIMGGDQSSAEKSSNDYGKDGCSEEDGDEVHDFTDSQNIFMQSADSDFENNPKIVGNTPVSFGGGVAKSHPISSHHSRRPSFNMLYTAVGPGGLKHDRYV